MIVILIIAKCVHTHRWSRNPLPQPPTTFSKVVSLIQFKQSYIFLHWLPGALVGVGGSDLIA